MRVGIFNPYGIGDVLSSFPMIAALKEKLNTKFLAYISNKRAKDVLLENPYIDKIVVYERDDIKKSPLKEGGRFLKQIWDLKLDLVFDLTMNRNLSFLLFLSRIKRRVGFNYKGRGTFLTHKRKISGFTEPVSWHYFSLLYLIWSNIDFEVWDFPIKIYLNEDERKFADLLIYNLGLDEDITMVGVFPGGGSSWADERYARIWQFENFIEIIRRLIDSGIIVMVFGDGRDLELGEIPFDLLRTRRVFDLRGRLTLRETLSLVDKMRCCLTNDGGPLYLSKAVGKDVVCILGPVPEDVYVPKNCVGKTEIVVNDIECRPCYKNFRMPKCTQDFRCVRNISVDAVWDRLSNLIWG